MISARLLRSKEELNKIPDDRPGYYKWYAEEDDFRRIADVLGFSADEAERFTEKKEGKICIYVGIAVHESLRSRLNWHVNQHHTVSCVRSGFLSTLRQSVSSIVAGDQMAEKETNGFIDRLYVEYFPSPYAVDSSEAEESIGKAESDCMQDHLCVLNIRGNKNPRAKEIVKSLKSIRRKGKRK